MRTWYFRLCTWYIQGVYCFLLFLYWMRLRRVWMADQCKRFLHEEQKHVQRWQQELFRLQRRNKPTSSAAAERHAGENCREDVLKTSRFGPAACPVHIRLSAADMTTKKLLVMYHSCVHSRCFLCTLELNGWFLLKCFLGSRERTFKSSQDLNIDAVRRKMSAKGRQRLFSFKAEELKVWTRGSEMVSNVWPCVQGFMFSVWWWWWWCPRDFMQLFFCTKETPACCGAEARWSVVLGIQQILDKRPRPVGRVSSEAFKVFNFLFELFTAQVGPE